MSLHYKENMNNKYDVIVIGAGNAGLSAAATAAGEGLKTLLLERNNLPGGCATSFRRGRFEFEASLHELANIGTPERPGSIRKLFEQFGTDIDWHIDKTAFRAIADGDNGYDVTMPTGIREFCDQMERLVPGSRESTEAVFRLSEKADAAIAYLSQGKPDGKILMEEHADFLRMASHTVEECLDALGMPKKAQHILATYWPYLGAPADRLDFMYYSMMLKRYIDIGPALPRMRSHEISLALEGSVRSNGGEIWYNTEAERLIIKDGRVCGVVAGGRELYADRVICNAYPDIVYSDLLERGEAPARALKLANARKGGALFFTVYLGLNRSCEELGIRDYSVFMHDSPDSSEQYEACADADKGIIIVNCLNRAIPDSSPEGTCTLFFTALLREAAWGDIEPKDYKRVKNRIARRMIEACERRLGLEIQPHIEEIVISTPATFARYLNTPNGTPYGYEISLWDSMIARTMSRGTEQFFEGMEFAGAHGERTDGYSSAYANGNSAGKRAVKEVKRNDEL